MNKKFCQESYQCQVILLSSNNLRPQPLPNQNFPNTVSDIIPLYQKLITSGRQYEKLKFVFCAIVPSPETDYRSKLRFVDFNGELKKICEENSDFCFYFNTPSFFTVSGNICSRFFHFDGIHLSIVGVEMLCHRLSSFVKTLPKK